MAPSPEKIAQKTTFLPAFAVWVGYRSSRSRARRVDYKDEINSVIEALNFAHRVGYRSSRSRARRVDYKDEIN